MILVLAGVGRSLRNVVGGDGLLSFSAFVGVYHQQLDEQFISLSSQLKIKHIHPIAFARVVGGKHQTTADEFGIPTGAKTKLKTPTKAKNPYRKYGTELLENGTELICKTPHIAPLAWCHQVYPPLDEKYIYELELEMRINIPKDYQDFLKETNGTKLFNSGLKLYGMRFNFTETYMMCGNLSI
jgi:hypothetical protein